MSTPKQDIMYIQKLFDHAHSAHERALGYAPVERIAKFLDTKTDDQKQAIKETLTTLLQQPPIQSSGESDMCYIMRYQLWIDKTSKLEQHITMFP